MTIYLWHQTAMLAVANATTLTTSPMANGSTSVRSPTAQPATTSRWPPRGGADPTGGLSGDHRPWFDVAMGAWSWVQRS